MDRSTKLVLGSLLLSNFLVAMDTTILNTTGPIVTDEIGGTAYYAWIFAIYTLLSTITVPIFGKLADRYGRKNIFLLSTLLFTIASLMCGIATSMPELIAYRALKGIGAGGMLPTAAIILGDLLPVEKRGKFQGHFSLIWGISALLGPLVGALIIQVLDWRWIFYINIPLGIIVMLFTLSYKENIERFSTPIQWRSALLFAVATLTLLSITIDSSWYIYLLPVSILLLFLFYRSEKKTANPFLPIGILKNYPLLFFNINTFLFFFALFGLESFVPFFLQKVQGSSVLLSGLVLAGISIGWILSSYPSGKIITRYGYRLPILIGNLVITLSTIPFFFYTEDTPLWLTFLILLTHGFCYGLIQTTASIGSYELAKPEEKGFSSSLQSFARNIGTSFSLGYMGALVIKDPFYILYAAGILSICALLISIVLLAKNRSESF
ncbi:MFS transporter [Bacillus sp. Brlt_9]|uniref:MFS transporter n=1 Tax=Bacillus sp. Brlt_9 TaxID=3110916 RepID=UPI003F7B7846